MTSAITNLSDIRRHFLHWFETQDHQIVPSSTLVPRNDPSLMFTNSGMVQFKNLFTGLEKRDYQRAVTAQKCVRAGGKHNDLANVGRTARHHTFFEMLGNFSFGDYFKERAIELAWTMVTKELGLDPDRLLVTVYHEDEQAFNLWGSIAGLDERRILKIATSDNFWQMGDVGPCGPCSEIFYDHGDSIEGGPPGSADEDGDRFVEIWNLVFMQFEQHEDGTRTALPRPSIDTGMGLERIAAVLQGKHNNFDIDLFSDLTRSIADLTQDKTSDLSKDQRLVSYRVIADHLRSIGFLIAEGVMPANEGRGYVLRRIMRRAMRHAYMLGAEDPVLHRLTHALTDQMGSHYGELIRAQHLIEQTIHSEEQRFLTMLARGTQLLQAKLARLGEGQILDGESAFNLYDTYGFPLDLTEDIASHHGVRVDGAGFDAAMAAQRQRARKAWAGSGASATDKRWLELADAVGAGEFLGYQCQQSEGLITALLDTSHQRTNQLHSGAEGWLIANQTPFYGESGGQEGDQGTITTRDGGCFQVNDTVIIAGLILHKGHVKKDKPAVAVGDQALFAIDRQRRNRLCANHSATHLLHQALRRVLGGHVVQKGSLVSEGMLRFDFTHSGPLETGELALIEQSVNRHIRMNGAVTTQMMGSDAAIEQGAIALFGEKYPDEVRVLQMGEEPDGKAWSVELCGGTHVSRLGEIGGFRIIHQSGVAAGIRRIEAVTGEAMIEQAREQGEQLRTAAGLLRIQPGQLEGQISQLLHDRKAMQREISDLKRKLAQGLGDASNGAAEQIAGIMFTHKTVRDLQAGDCRDMVDRLKQQMGSGLVLLINVQDDNRAGLLVGVTSDLTDRFDAVQLVRLAAGALGGRGGGGRPDLAQSGASDASNPGRAIQAVQGKIKELAQA